METIADQTPDPAVLASLRLVLVSVSVEECLIAETLISRLEGVHEAITNPLNGQLFVRFGVTVVAPDELVAALHEAGFETRSCGGHAFEFPLPARWQVAALLGLPALIAILCMVHLPQTLIAIVTLAATLALFAVVNPSLRRISAHLKQGFFSQVAVGLLAIMLGSVSLALLPDITWFAPGVAAIPLGWRMLQTAEQHARRFVLRAAGEHLDATDWDAIVDGTAARPQNQVLANQLAKVAPHGMFAMALMTLFIWVLAPSAMHDLNAWASVLPWVPGRDTSGWAAGLWAATGVLLLAMPGVYLLVSAPALLCASSWAMRNGVHVVRTSTWQPLRQTRTVLFGRANVLTQGVCQVTDVIPVPGVSRDDLLQCAAAAEANVESPVARAILEGARRHHVSFTPLEESWFLPGEGVLAESEGEMIRMGSAVFVGEHTRNQDHFQQDRYRLSREGKAEIFVVRGGTLLGMLGVLDKFVPDVVSAMKAARAMNLTSGMLSGTPAATAKTLADQAGIPNAHGDLAPGRAGRIVDDYKRKTIFPVVFVGRGLRHEAALARADVRVQAADDTVGEPDVRLIKPGARPFLAALQLARVAYFMINQNLFTAIAINFLLLPCAVLGWFAPPLPFVLVGAVTLVLVRRAHKLLSFDAEADLRERLRR